MSAINYFDFEKRCNLIDASKRTDITNEFIWGVSVVKIGSNYHAYIERWIDDDGLSGYAYYGRIYHSSSSDPLGPFDTMTECTGLRGITANAGAVFNGDPIVKNGFVYLFYSGTTSETPSYPLLGTNARNNNRVFLAKAPLNDPTNFTLVGSAPILAPGAGELLVNNSRYYLDIDGNPKMIYKYSTIAAPSVPLIAVASADDIEGPWTIASSPISVISNSEDPCVWREGDLFFIIVKENGSDGRLYYSKTGYADDWVAVTEKARAYRLTAVYTALTSQTHPRMERPFVLVENGEAIAFYLSFLINAETSSFNQGRTIRT